MDDVKIFEDPSNWKQHRMPCKADRIIFPDTVSVIINSSVSAKEIVLPYNGAIIFGEKAKIELFENEADASCPGEEMIFTGNGASHWESTNQSFIFGRLLLNSLIVVLICSIVFAVYLNQVRGVTVNEMFTVVSTGVRQVTGRLSRFYVQRPVEGTYNFVRFQGDDDDIGLELGTHALGHATVSRAGHGEGSSEERNLLTMSKSAPAKPARSLRGLGYVKMSDIEEIEEEEACEGQMQEEVEDREVQEFRVPEVVADPSLHGRGLENEMNLLLDEQ